MTRFEVHDRVRFASEWLRNTGQFAGPEGPTSVGPWARGNVVEVEESRDRQIVTVEWGDGEITRAISVNLEKSV